MQDAVVITGAGLVCSLGHKRDQVWNALLECRSGVRPIETFDAQGFDFKFAAQVQGLDRMDLGLQPVLAGLMAKHLSMLMKCTEDAFAESELSGLPGDDIGFFAGMGMVDYEIEDLLGAVSKSMDPDGKLNYDLFFSAGYREIYPLWPLAMLNNVAFCHVATKLDLRGENAVFCPHADSGAFAVAEGVSVLLECKAKAVLAGGVSEKVCPSSLARAHLAGILSPPLGEGGSTCRPFSAERNGTVLGEGCGMLTLERRTEAEARGKTGLAVISGFGFSCEIDSKLQTPTTRAISAAMQNALTNAGIEPEDIDVIVAHGDGTCLGDKHEAEAVCRVFSRSLSRLKVFSSKGALGHLFAASPAVDIVLAVEMLRTGIIPPTCNALPKDPNIKFDPVCGSPLQTRPRRIMINSFSYEGQCASLIIEALDNRGPS